MNVLIVNNLSLELSVRKESSLADGIYQIYERSPKIENTFRVPSATEAKDKLDNFE